MTCRYFMKLKHFHADIFADGVVKSLEDGGPLCGVHQSDEGEPLGPASFAGKYFLQIIRVIRHGVLGIKNVLNYRILILVKIL